MRPPAQLALPSPPHSPAGTGAVVTAGFVNGMKYQGTELRDARVVFFGAGSSAVGVAGTIATFMQKARRVCVGACKGDGSAAAQLPCSQFRSAAAGR